MRSRTHSAGPARRRAVRRERGSAYIIALLVIVVLTFLGLTLSVITSTEMQLGANDRILQRALYAADAGLHYATARVLVTKETRAVSLAVAERVTAGPDVTPNASTAVQLAAAMPVIFGPAAYSEVNNVGTYSSKAASRTVIALAAAGQRQAEGATGPVASRTLTTLLDAQPFDLPPSAFNVLGSQTAVAGETVDEAAARAAQSRKERDESKIDDVCPAMYPDCN